MLVEIDGLGLSLGGAPILEDVHLSFGEGEIYGLLGPNGAGKSTTIAVALGLLEPDRGHVRVLGRDPRLLGPESRARIGVLSERNGFYDWMSAREYLAFFAALHGRHLEPCQIRQRLSAVGVESGPRQPIGTLSHGMRQRLGLARALIADPELLVLDEPTNGLDPRGRREVHDLLLELAGRGVGILLCTHLLDDVARLCGRAGIIVEGRTVAEGAIADLIRTRKRQDRFRLRLTGMPPATGAECPHASVVAREGEWWIVELDPMVAADTAWRELLFRGWPIAEIRREDRGLEDLYLALTRRMAA
jgi:ABC-2 type transport system ATP-binding protein